MSSKGVDETTIQEITELADVGFGTFYNYFSTKDEIATAVLDCVIHTLGRRNDVANQKAGVVDQVEIVANSVRMVAREMMADPMWRWWLKRTDLMVKRMRAVFGPFGLRDIEIASANHHFHVAGGDMETAWSHLIWILAGSITDIADGYASADTERLMAEAVLRVMGVEFHLAKQVASRPLPELSHMQIDFSFLLHS